MTARYTIAIDVVRSRATVTLAGFFEPKDLTAFIAARDREYTRLRCAPNQHVTLVDIREMAIQSQDVVAAFGALLANPRNRSRALAFVVARSLSRLQVERASTGRGARFFTSLAEAETWLATLPPASLAA